MRNWADFVSEGNVSAKFTEEHPILAVMGGYQVGKSTLLNCLLNHYIALAGKGLATTSLASRYKYGDSNIIEYRTKPESIYGGDLHRTTLDIIREKDFIKNVDLKSGFHIEARVPAELLRYCDIVDTPGYNANTQDSSIAINTLSHINYILFVIPNRGLNQPEKELLTTFRDNHIPFSLLMNCSIGRREERWIPDNSINAEIAEESERWLSAMGINPIPIDGEKVYICNLLFYWSQIEEYTKSLNDIDRPDTVFKHIIGIMKEEGYGTGSEDIKRASRFIGLHESLKKILISYDPLTHRIG